MTPLDHDIERFRRMVASLPPAPASEWEHENDRNAAAKRDAQNLALVSAMLESKRCPCIARAVEERVRSMRNRTGFQTLEALAAGDHATYSRFLAGCRRAVVRQRALWGGHVTRGELASIRRAQRPTEYAEFDRAASDDWRDAP